MSIQSCTHACLHRGTPGCVSGISHLGKETLALGECVDEARSVPEQIAGPELLPEVTAIRRPVGQHPVQVVLDDRQQSGTYIGGLSVLEQDVCEHHEGGRPQSRTISLRTAPSSHEHFSVGQFELRVDANVETLRISLILNLLHPVDIGLELLLDLGEVEVVELQVGAHGQGGVSHPVVVVGTDWSSIVRRSHDSTLALDVDVGVEQGVHFAVEGGVEAHPACPVVGNVAADVGAGGVVAPGDALQLSWLASGTPAAALGHALCLVDAQVAAVSARALGHFTLLGVCGEEESSQDEELNFHVSSRFILMEGECDIIRVSSEGEGWMKHQRWDDGCYEFSFIRMTLINWSHFMPSSQGQEWFCLSFLSVLCSLH